MKTSPLAGHKSAFTFAVINVVQVVYIVAH